MATLSLTNLLLLLVIALVQLKNNEARELKSLTSFTGSKSQYGIMFDLQAVSRKVIVSEFHLHLTSAGTFLVEVFTLDGKSHTTASKTPTAWTENSAIYVNSKGSNVPTALALATTPTISTTTGFYITTVGKSMFNFVDNKSTGAVFSSDTYIKMLVGTGKWYKFGRNAFNESFDGSVIYTIEGEVSSPTVPTPTPPSTPTSCPTSLTTKLDGKTGQAGIMFDITALQDVTIKSFDIHTPFSGGTQVIVSVYKTKAYGSSFFGIERNASLWTTVVSNELVTGKGEGNLTPLNNFVESIAINKGSKRGFYVTIVTTCLSCSYMKMSETSTMAAASSPVFMKNAFVEVSVGKSVRYAFGRLADQRGFNGAVKYSSSGSSCTLPPATPTNPPPGSSSCSTSLVTKVDGATGQAGIMFDINALQNIVLKGVSVHTSIVGSISVSVYMTKSVGVSFLNFERDPNMWSSVTIEEAVIGKGQGSLTPLKDFTQSISIEKGSKRGLYVTIVTTCLVCSDLRMTETSALASASSLFVKDNNMQVSVGKSVRYPFGRLSDRKGFNGALSYTSAGLSCPSPPSTPTTPTPSGSCSTSLTTDTGGKAGQAGIMFDIVALKNVEIKGLSVHTTIKGSLSVSVYKAKTSGTSFIGIERTATSWSAIMEGMVVNGLGEGVLTPLNDFGSALSITQGSKQGIYVTVVTTCQNCTYLKMTETTASAATSPSYMKDAFVQISVGKSVRYPFGFLADKRGFNGAVKYTATGVSCPPSPTPPVITPTPPTPVTPTPPTPTQPTCNIPTNSATCPYSSREACSLYKLYVATNGCSWKQSSNWLGTIDYCQWYGVSCNSSNSVTKLALFSNSLRGTLPTELGELLNLTHLDLANNAIYSTVPTQLGFLQNLATVKLEANDITGTVSNASPVCTLKSKKLTIFTMDCVSEMKCECCTACYTNAPVPGPPTPTPPTSCNIPTNSAVCPYTSRETCSLYRLYVATSGCSWTQRSNWLVTTDHCQWYGVSCDSSKSVTRLQLYSNGLRGTLPTELGELLSLSDLDLGRNAISSTVPTNLGYLQNLITLKLEANDITGTVANNSQVCTLKSRKLAIFTMDCVSEMKCECCTTCYTNAPIAAPPSPTTPTCNIPTNSAVCPYTNRETCSLYRLYVGTNGCSWTQRSNWLVTTDHCQWHGVTCNTSKSVTRLQLFKNGLHGTLPTELGELLSLTDLDLGSNRISSTLPTHLGFLSNLATLKLEANDITGTVANNSQICALKSKKLSVFTMDCVSEMKCECCTTCYTNASVPAPPAPPTVTCLDVNTFTCFSRDCDVLKTLFVATNGCSWGSRKNWLIDPNICSWEGVTCGNTGGVVMLDLHNKNLTGSIPTMLGMMIDLTKLDLATNTLQGTLPTNLGLLTKVTHLNLSNNKVVGTVSATHPLCTRTPAITYFATDCGSTTSTYIKEITCSCCNVCYGTGIAYPSKQPSALPSKRPVASG